VSKGIIFTIEEFAVHDGPGIRKMVFFKGCPLHCSWCHNPEGLSFKRELMVSEATCTHCDKCRDACIHDECEGFGRCVKVCSQRLPRIAGQEYEASELAKIVLKGKEVLTGSGGGITISGGEPLAQPDFLFALISHLKPVHVAIETSGYARAEIFQRMVSETDMVLMDLKHTDPEIHMKFTGVDNTRILENLQYLCMSDTPFHIRIPLIPGVNDTLSNMEQMAFLLKDAKNLRSVEFLPYHKTAPAKYVLVNRPYTPGFDTTKKVEVHREAFKKHNIKVNIL
jgi:pyruvate formate lyase activating enzyme